MCTAKGPCQITLTSCLYKHGLGTITCFKALLSLRKRGIMFLPALVSLSVCLFVTTITKYNVDGSGRNFLARFLGGKASPSSFSVTMASRVWRLLVLDRVRHFRPIPIHRFFAVSRCRYRCDTDVFALTCVIIQEETWL